MGRAAIMPTPMPLMNKLVDSAPLTPELSPKAASMSQLVEQLTQGDHPITLGGSSPSLDSLRSAIERNYVHIRFTDTRGETELGVELDKSACDVGALNGEPDRGSIHLEGELKLDYVAVRCIADLEVANLQGSGHLQLSKAEAAPE